jgi:hypothetical protein
MMAARYCGPFSPLTRLMPTEVDYELAVVTPDTVSVDTAREGDTRDVLRSPLFKQTGDESSIRGYLTISREHWKISPCLKSAKVTKR